MNQERFDAEFDNNPLFQVKLLAQRVDTLGREKEQIEDQLRDHSKRLGKIEHNLAMGWGILIVLPILGTILGFLFAYGKIIFKPWM